jgi:PAS domain S-box-containing protein
MANAPDSDDHPAEPNELGTAPEYRLLEGVTSHALFRLDSEGAIATWPTPARNLYGYDSETVLGRQVSTLFADDKRDEPETADSFLDGAKDETVEVERWHERADGSVFWGTLNLSPLWNDGFEGYAAVCQDTTTTKEYERMLERQNDRLKEFTDILAHDLRNPLNIIDQRLSLYEETGEAEHIRSIEETTDRMERLVDDLLRVARQGGVVKDPVSTDIEAIVDTAWEGTGHTADATLRYADVRSVSSDPDRLCELFENLFRNAVEHGGDGVTVEVGPLDDGFYIEDDGAGIPENLHDDVFDHGVTTDDDGSGYGLSVVRTIVNAHGWDIATVEAETGGARFEITGIEFLD